MPLEQAPASEGQAAQMHRVGKSLSKKQRRQIYAFSKSEEEQQRNVDAFHKNRKL